MSIIHEALKKVQANLQGRQESAPSASPSESTQPPPIAQIPVANTPIPSELPPPGESLTQSVPEAKKHSFKFLHIVLPLLIAASLWFCYRQVEHYFPGLVPPIKSLIKLPQMPKIPLAHPAPKTVTALPKTEQPSQSDPANVLKLQGIMSKNGTNIAIINNKIYEQGSEINGVKILQIDMNAVTILKDGKEETLTVTH